jgi:hypothetical protein
MQARCNGCDPVVVQQDGDTGLRRPASAVDQGAGEDGGIAGGGWCGAGEGHDGR